ncbi:MAG: hypothetical protein U5K00_12055 [Melioribacteraceae bacterium]|nr:hypothetical protein [Melioribacteraceae bacterium]
MKKLFTVFSVVLFFALSSNVFAQLAKDSWGFGFGFSYPRMISHSVTVNPADDGVGGFLSIQEIFLNIQQLDSKVVSIIFLINGSRLK